MFIDVGAETGSTVDAGCQHPAGFSEERPAKSASRVCSGQQCASHPARRKGKRASGRGANPAAVATKSKLVCKFSRGPGDAEAWTRARSVD